MMRFHPSRQQRGAGHKGVAPGQFASESPCVCCRAAAYTEGGGTPPPVDATGYREFELGDITLYPMQDGTVAMPVDNVLGDEVAAEVAAGGFERHLSEEGALPFSYGCTLAAVAGKHVLMDTSLGHVDPPDTTPSRDIRTLLQAAAGITRHDIDAVTLSHGHPDHVAGSVLRADDGELVPMFPNAVHYMQRAESTMHPTPCARPGSSTHTSALSRTPACFESSMVSPNDR